MSIANTFNQFTFGFRYLDRLSPQLRGDRLCAAFDIKIYKPIQQYGRLMQIRKEIWAQTQGKLSLCLSNLSLPCILFRNSAVICLAKSRDIKDARDKAASIAKDIGFDEIALQDLSTAVSEAAMNAIVHGGGGICRISRKGNKIHVRVEDTGEGIALEHMTQAVLEFGFSTGASGGYGWFLMLAGCDRASLATGKHGTVVVLEFVR
jgi:anti-sigma regulatory factor (Ser/Thr protein kinase)